MQRACLVARIRYPLSLICYGSGSAQKAFEGYEFCSSGVNRAFSHLAAARTAGVGRDCRELIVRLLSEHLVEIKEAGISAR